MPEHGPVIGVDIGGTKIAAAVIADGAVAARETAATPRGGGADVMRAVTGVVGRLIAEAGDVQAIGVGAPGVVGPETGAVISATDVLPGWAGTDVRGLLERQTGVPVAVDNDVRVMARGAIGPVLHAGARDVLFVSVGTGIGGALARGGDIYNGAHGCAGEIAHLAVSSRGATRCGCGREDHVEAVASGPAIAAEYARRTGDPGLDLRAIAERAHGGDGACISVITDAATLLGRALAGLINAVDVEAVVLGGGVTQIGDLFLDPVADAIRQDVLPPLRGMAITAARSGTDAPLIGAALLALNNLAATAGTTRWEENR